jgi:hypothetical protein
VRVTPRFGNFWTNSKPTNEAERAHGNASAATQILRRAWHQNRDPDDRNFETEGEAIESGLRRTIEAREMVMRSLIRAVYRFRDAALVAEKKDDFGGALPLDRVANSDLHHSAPLRSNCFF